VKQTCSILDTGIKEESVDAVKKIGGIGGFGRGDRRECRSGYGLGVRRMLRMPAPEPVTNVGLMAARTKGDEGVLARGRMRVANFSGRA